MDYADVTFELKTKRDVEFEDAFYFYEACENKGLLLECKTWEEVVDECVKLWDTYGEKLTYESI